MFIWQGWGILVFFLYLLPSALLYLIHNSIYGDLPNNAFLSVGGFFAAIAGIFLVWMLSKKLGSKPGKTLIDKETGQEVVVRQKHSFFFIDVKYWPAILIVLSIFGLIYGFWQK